MCSQGKSSTLRFKCSVGRWCAAMDSWTPGPGRNIFSLNWLHFSFNEVRVFELSRILLCSSSYIYLHSHRLLNGRLESRDSLLLKPRINVGYLSGYHKPYIRDSTLPPLLIPNKSEKKVPIPPVIISVRRMIKILPKQSRHYAFTDVVGARA